MIICHYCKKEYSKHGIKSHIWRKHTTQGQMHKPTAGKIPWNKGLTKESDERLQKAGIKTSKALVGRMGHKMSDATKEKLRKIILKKIKNNTWHNSFSKARTHEYNGIKLYGKWELEYAKWLDRHNIKWERPTKAYPYIFENKKHMYTPDFYLPENNEYVEIKGYETERDRAKWKYFPNNLLILKGSDLQELGIINSYKQI